MRIDQTVTAPLADPPPSYDKVVRNSARSCLSIGTVTNHAAPSGWRQARESAGALSEGDYRLTRFPCGALPEDVMAELKQALALRQRTDIDLHAARDRLSCLTRQASGRQERPSAPSYTLIGNGLCEDIELYSAPPERHIRRVQKEVAALEEKKRDLAARHLEKMKDLELRQLKAEARLRSKVPPANPPPGGYLPPALRRQP